MSRCQSYILSISRTCEKERHILETTPFADLAKETIHRSSPHFSPLCFSPPPQLFAGVSNKPTRVRQYRRSTLGFAMCVGVSVSGFRDPWFVMCLCVLVSGFSEASSEAPVQEFDLTPGNLEGEPVVLK